MDVNVMRFATYMQTQSETREAYAGYNYSACKLELAHVKERNAELASQSFEAVAKGELAKRLGPLTEREREIGIAFARYAAIGRCDA